MRCFIPLFNKVLASHHSFSSSDEAFQSSSETATRASREEGRGEAADRATARGSVACKIEGLIVDFGDFVNVGLMLCRGRMRVFEDNDVC